MTLRLKEMSIESYKSIIEYNPDAIFILSLDGIIEEINQVTSKMFGYSKEEMQGKNYEEFMVPACKDFTYRQFKKVLRGHSAEYETQLYHKNGKKVYLEVKNIPLWDHDEIVGIFGVAKDITELYHTKATLHEMDERFKSLYYSTGDAINILDLDGNVIDVNPAFEETYGWKREELIGKPLPIIIEDYYEHQEKIVLNVKKGKHTRGIETICIKKDGTPIHVSLTFSPIFDTKGNVIGTVGITRDITERKQLEKSLRESEERYRKVVELSPKGIIIQREGIILYANPSALNVVKESQAVGNYILDYIHPKYHALSKERFVQSSTKEEEWPFVEFQLMSKDGEIIDVEVNSVSINYQEDAAILTIINDITERKKVEQDLHESLKNIEDIKKALDESSIVAITNQRGIIEYVNDKFCKISQYSSAELIGKDHKILNSGYHSKEFFKEMWKTIGNGKTWRGEIRNKAKDGSFYWVDTTIVPFLSEKGKPYQYVSIRTDITAKKLAEEALRTSEERYRNLIEFLPEPILIHKEGYIQYGNPASVKLLGASTMDDLEGKSILDFSPPEYMEMVQNRINQLIQPGIEVSPVEERVICLDKKILDVEISGISIIYEDKPSYLMIIHDITRRKQAENALRQSEEHYRLIAENMTDLLGVLDETGRVQYASPSHELVLGLPPEIYEGNLARDVVHPDDALKLHQFFEEAITTKGNVSKEFRLKRADGHYLWFESEGNPVYDGNGNFLHILVIARNITERKQSEEALRQSEEKFRLIAENMTDLIGILDVNGVVKYASPSHEFVLGFPPQFYEGNLAFGLVHPNDVINVQSQFTEMTQTKEHRMMEFRYKHINGHWVWVEAKGTPVLDKDGNLLHFMIVARDTTRRRQGVAALRKSEERYRLITENMTDLVCVIDKDVYFKYASPSHISVLGDSSDEYEGKCALDWIHEADVEGIKHQLKTIIESKESANIEYRFRNVNGDWIWLEAKVTPIFTEDGQFIHFLVVSREITERRMYEEKLTYLAFHDTLTGLPNRRLFTDRLEQAIKEAKRYKRKMAVMFMDLDRFKQINDTLGHDAGDELLKQFANRVKCCLRECDTLARQGGDEFTVLLPEIQNEQVASTIAQRILDSLQEKWVIGEHSFHTTSSIGIALYPTDGTNRYFLMKHADKALYEAKEDGRNNYKIYFNKSVTA